MPYVSAPERVGRRRGFLESVQEVLLARFGDEGAALMPQVEAVEMTDNLRSVLRTIVTATNLDEVRQAIATACQSPPSP